MSQSTPKNKEMLIDLCRMLHNAMAIDLELLDENLNVLVRYFCCEPPQGMIYNLETYYKNMTDSFTGIPGDVYLYHEIPPLYQCYLDLKLEYSFGLFYISLGPFLTQSYSEGLIAKILQNHSFPNSFYAAYRAYYANMRYFSDTVKDMAMIAMQLLTDHQETADLPVVFSHAKTTAREIKVNTEYWENRQQDILNSYQMEKKWRSAVQNGDYNTAISAFRKLSSGEFLHRTPGNPQRTQRNLLITVNTLCRAAAADAGIDPICIHELSDSFSRKIEQTRNALEIQELHHQMLHAYSDLVKRRRVNIGSPIVSEAIAYLYTYYRQRVTLKQAADALHVSESHLSRVFAKETGMTFGKYLNHIRIQEALFMLDTSKDIPITEAALLVGFSSYSKFSIAFKEEMGVSARAYLKGSELQVL